MLATVEVEGVDVDEGEGDGVVGSVMPDGVAEEVDTDGSHGEAGEGIEGSGSALAESKTPSLLHSIHSAIFILLAPTNVLSTASITILN